MRQVVAAYHSLSSYSDRGTSIVRLAGNNAVYRIDLETVFKRPNKLRFACTMESSRTPGYKQRGIIWSDGTTAWALYSFHNNKLERKKNLDLAIASASGVSWGVAHTIPRLLTDEVTGVRLDEVNRLRIVGNETVDGVDCFVLVGYFASGEECKLWIGHGDYLIRRIETRSETLEQEEVRTQVAINQDIGDSQFTKRGR
jgi:outer membrane lipoprotein-sorting protein